MNPTRSPRPIRLGCVKFLNARPLIHGLQQHPSLDIRFDAPSRLLDDLVNGEVDMALCPVIDYQRSPIPLAIVPVGGIGCNGPTLTVRLFSRKPIEQLRTIHADTDSHTSVALLKIIMARMFHREVELIDLPSHTAAEPEAMLLIGDKVVSAGPLPGVYPHELDLGEAWRELTSLPFVFAVWMARPDAELGEAPQLLERQRQLNAQQVDAVVAAHAAALGWPADLARQYLTNMMRYAVGRREMEAMQRFFQMAAADRLIEHVRPIQVHDAAAPPLDPETDRISHSSATTRI